MKRTFDATSVDFTPVSPDPGLFFQDFQHRAEIELDEEGTVAVAVTRMIGGMGGIPPKPAE